jgi:hypothetical protein
MIRILRIRLSLLGFEHGDFLSLVDVWIASYGLGYLRIKIYLLSFLCVPTCKVSP